MHIAIQKEVLSRLLESAIGNPVAGWISPFNSGKIPESIDLRPFYPEFGHD